MKTRKLIKLVFISVLLFSCKKQYKEDTTVYFHLYNPVTNEAYSGVKVAIYELKDVTPTLSLSDSKYDSNKIWEGVTDSYGKASHSFKGYKSDKYTYWHFVDESIMTGKSKIDQPEYGPLKMASDNNLIYKIVSNNISFVIWRKNTNCFDENDKCRIRSRKYLSAWGNWEEWGGWGPQEGSINYPNGYYEGCDEHISNILISQQEIREIEMEVTKNGITTITRDTLYIIGNNSVDTLKYFY